jgi:DNA-binding transcriptional ArsR family regulator
MKTPEAAKLFEVLSSEVRLDIFRLLVKHAPDGLVAGKIAKLLNLPSTNLSFHLKAITHTGLVSLEKEGRFSRYRANIPLMLEVIAFLTSECCAGHPERCLNLPTSCASPLAILPTFPNNEEK